MGSFVGAESLTVGGDRIQSSDLALGAPSRLREARGVYLDVMSRGQERPVESEARPALESREERGKRVASQVAPLVFVSD